MDITSLRVDGKPTEEQVLDAVSGGGHIRQDYELKTRSKD